MFCCGEGYVIWEKENEKCKKRETVYIYIYINKFNVLFHVREERKVKEICYLVSLFSSVWLDKKWGEKYNFSSKTKCKQQNKLN
jgi:hypothetical protein